MALALLAGVAQADTQTRTSSFDYSPQGQLQTQTLEPTNPNDCLQSTYTYTGYGDPASTSAVACAGAAGNTVASAGVARFTPIVSLPKLASHDFGKIKPAFPHWRHKISRAQPHSDRTLTELPS